MVSQKNLECYYVKKYHKKLTIEVSVNSKLYLKSILPDIRQRNVCKYLRLLLNVCEFQSFDDCKRSKYQLIFVLRVFEVGVWFLWLNWRQISLQKSSKCYLLGTVLGLIPNSSTAIKSFTRKPQKSLTVSTVSIRSVLSTRGVQATLQNS